MKRPHLTPTRFHGMLTVAPQMLAFFELVKRVARTEANVLVRGETGTGKELVARAIHALSPRAAGPFNAVNCATFTPELMASELFGHVRGAFTGATNDRQGLFEVSHGGTLFLDEIAELSPELQSRLLRVLEERAFTRVGSTKPVKVNVRLISATHKALRRELAAGRFREDLMYRVRVVPLFLPRLAQRTGDVAMLTWMFVDEFNRYGYRKVETVEKGAYEALLAYDWPGNVRELRNNIEYAFAIGEGPVLKLSELTPELRGEGPPDREDRAAPGTDLLRRERERILGALGKAGGKRGDAAALLGISRATLWRRMRELGLSSRGRAGS